MNCKWAEGYLSACLDGTLDPAVRDEVLAHLETCSNCSEILEDYRHFDGLVRDQPRYEPAPELRERLFNSPEYAAITRAMDESGAARHPIKIRPFQLSRPLSKGRGGAASHDRALTPLPLPQRDADTPDAPPAVQAETADAPAERTGPPVWARAAVAAALVAVVFGSALLWWQGRLHTGATTSPISNIGGYHGGTPLPAGPRVVYERGGALWSAPEQGTSTPQRLTPPSVVVGAGWAVAPVRANAGGDLVAYVDLKTGTLHVIRADNQSDRALGPALVPHMLASTYFWTTPEGQAILGSLIWSPDGTRIAALTDVTGTGRLALAVFTVDGNAARTVSTGVVANVAPVWSTDGTRLAFAEASGSGESVAEFNAASDQFKTVSAVAPDGPASATVAALGWLTSQGQPVLTWAASDGGITGIYAQAVLQDGAAQRLTPAGTNYSAAAFASASEGGLWLLGNGGALSSVSVPAGVLTQLAPVASGVSALAVSADGSTAVLSSAGTLQLWNAATGLTTVATGVAAQPGMAWSPDGTHIAFVASGQVLIAAVHAGAASAPVAVVGLSGATALAWAPDGLQLAVTTPMGVALVSASNATFHQIDPHAADGGPVWSVVR